MTGQTPSPQAAVQLPKASKLTGTRKVAIALVVILFAGIILMLANNLFGWFSISAF